MDEIDPKAAQQAAELRALPSHVILLAEWERIRLAACFPPILTLSAGSTSRA
jgi:hypothetical protein